MQISPGREPSAAWLPQTASTTSTAHPPEAALTIHLRDYPDGVLLTVGGEIDAHTIDRFEDACTLACAARPELMILDLQRVGFLGAAGLGVIVSCQRAVREGDGRLVLRGLSGRLRRAIEYAGLTDHLEIEDLVD